MRLVGEHTPQDPLVGLVGYHLLVQLLFSFAAFRCQDVPPIRVASDNLARARLFEPLGRTLMGLQFRHKKCSSGGTAETQIIAWLFPASYDGCCMAAAWQRFRNQVGKHLPDAMKTGRMAAWRGGG